MLYGFFCLSNKHLFGLFIEGGLDSISSTFVCKHRNLYFGEEYKHFSFLRYHGSKQNSCKTVYI